MLQCLVLESQVILRTVRNSLLYEQSEAGFEENY
jgi:hypothetical protein